MRKIQKQNKTRWVELLNHSHGQGLSGMRNYDETASISFLQAPTSCWERQSDVNKPWQSKHRSGGSK